MSLLDMLHYNDTQAMKKALAIFPKIIGMITNSPFYQGFQRSLIQDIYALLLNPQHVDSHNDIINIFTDVYVQMRKVSQVPLTTLCELLNMGPEFESQLLQKDLKEQSGVMKSILRSSMGVMLLKLSN
jgi:hypothetical protein